MKKLIGSVIAISAGLASPSVWAGPFSDELSRCLVTHTTQPDNTVFMRWFFSVFSVSPATKDLASVTEVQAKQFDKNVADLFQRLLTVDCRKEAVAALRYEGVIAMQNSFGMMGQMAVQALVKDPAVDHQLGRFADEIDNAKIDALLLEAGIQPEKRAESK